MPLKSMPYANARVFAYSNGDIALVSYRTNVIYLTADGWLTCFGLYSRTTIRHISAFMREYTPLTYHDAKIAWQENCDINIFTGEIREH